MKQGTAKTLGVAALGAAFAAVAAGTASAATTDALQTLPVQDTAKSLHANAPKAFAASEKALGAGGATVMDAAHRATPQTPKAKGLTSPFQSLLGGLPVAKGLQNAPLGTVPLSTGSLTGK